VLLVFKLTINGSLVIYSSRRSIKEDRWRRSAWASRRRVPSRHSLDWLKSGTKGSFNLFCLSKIL